MGCVAAGGGGEIAPTVEAQGGDDGVANGRQGLGSGAGMYLTPIFTEGLVPHGVQAILDGPVAAPDLLQLCRTRPGGRQT